MTYRSTSFVSRLLGGFRRGAEEPRGPVETLKKMAAERREHDAIAYRTRLFAEEPDLALPVLVEVRMGETFLRHADPVHARMSFDRALQLAHGDTSQAVGLRLARLAQQLAHREEPTLIGALLADVSLDPDLRCRLARRLAFLNGDTSWDMPAIDHVPPAPWEEPEPAESVAAWRPQDLSVWHDQAAGKSAADAAITAALDASLDVDIDQAPANSGGIAVDVVAGPSWDEDAEPVPRWNPATQRRERGGAKRIPRRRERSAPLAPLPMMGRDAD